MGWISIVMLVLEIVKLIVKIVDRDDRKAKWLDLDDALETATSFGDRTVLKGLRDRLKGK